MRIFEDKTETVTRTVLKELRCDICGITAPNGDWAGLHSHVDITVKHEESVGDALAGGSTTTCDIDICPHCFRGQVCALGTAATFGPVERQDTFGETLSKSRNIKLLPKTS